MPPRIMHSAGENIVLKDGKKLCAKHPDSYICYDLVPLQEVEDLWNPVKKAIDIVLVMLKDRMSLLELKKAGGRNCLYCAIYTKDHIALTLPSEISKEVADAGIDLGIEVFQEYAE